MKEWKVPVTWEMIGFVYVEAETLEDAIDIASDEWNAIPLPDDSDYVDGSWRVDEVDIETIHQLYNSDK